MASLFYFSPYGEVIRSVEGGDLVTMTYTGQEVDKDLGVMNYNARLYDPSLSRFLSVDPLRQFHSPYNYVGNNPFSFIDPSGMNGVPRTGPGTDPNGGGDVIGGGGGFDPAQAALSLYADQMFGSYSASRGYGPMTTSAGDASNVNIAKGMQTQSEQMGAEFDRRMDAMFYGYKIQISGGVQTKEMTIEGDPDIKLVRDGDDWSYDTGYDDLWETFHPNDPDFFKWLNNPNAIPLYSFPQIRSQFNSGFNKDKAVDYLTKKAYPMYDKETCGWCARAVKSALAEGGIIIQQRINSAKDYGPYLLNSGFMQMNRGAYTPEKGDIRVFPNYPGGSIHGHIDMYNGEKWISDFVEGIWPGPGYQRANKFKIYRW